MYQVEPRKAGRKGGKSLLLSVAEPLVLMLPNPSEERVDEEKYTLRRITRGKPYHHELAGAAPGDKSERIREISRLVACMSAAICLTSCFNMVISLSKRKNLTESNGATSFVWQLASFPTFSPVPRFCCTPFDPVVDCCNDGRGGSTTTSVLAVVDCSASLLLLETPSSSSVLALGRARCR